MASPKTKKELSAYLSILYHCLEREQVNEPQTIKEFRQEIAEIKARCIRCEVEVPQFHPMMVKLLFG